MRRLLRLLTSVVRRKPEAPAPKPWLVDRDGRVRTEKDRPVVLRASP